MMSKEPEYCDTCGVQFSYFGINCECHKLDLKCWSCGDDIDPNFGYHLVDGKPTCEECEN